MTTPDAKLPKALWLDKTRFEHRMKTDPDADKLRAALPEKIKDSLDRSERFEPVTPYLVCAIAARYHLRPFHNFRHAVDVVLASSHLVRKIQQDHAEPFTDQLVIAALLISALVSRSQLPMSTQQSPSTLVKEVVEHV